MTLNDVLFDLDGTLIDSYEEIAATIGRAMECIGKTPLSIPRSIIGLSLKEIVLTIYRGIDEAEYGMFERQFRTIYDSSDYAKTFAMKGAEELLNYCVDRGLRLHVATMKPRLPTERILKRLSWGHFFESLTCGDSVPANQKGKTGVLAFALSENTIDKNRACYIGDYPSDIRAARENGLFSIAFSGGYGDLDAIVAEHPDEVCPSINQITNVLDKLR
jgi:phosphoglycolate phosphatase-like HAD superfamily hydrolase